MQLNEAMLCHIQGNYPVLVTYCHASIPECIQKASLFKALLVGLKFSLIL